PIANGTACNSCFRTSRTTIKRGAPGSPIANSSMGCSGVCTAVHPGATSPPAMGRGRPSTTASAVGGSPAPGCGSSPPRWITSIGTVGSVGISGVSTPRSSALPALPAGRKKNPDLEPWFLGPKTREFLEPPEHALGYSRGGFGTKVHLLIETHGIPVGIPLTGGERHACDACAPLMDQRF